MSAQAVGGAVGHNEISIIVPCHRVVGTNGSLTGYAGGIEKKVELLKLENVDMKQFSIPKERDSIMKPATLEASNILLPYKLPIQSFAPLIQSIVCLDAAPRGFSRGAVVDF